MSTDDRLTALREELTTLDDSPLSQHPDVLERVHRELVEELESLEDLDTTPDAEGGAD